MRYGADCWPLFTKALGNVAEDVKGLSVYSLGYLSPPTNWFGTAMPLVSKWPATFELNGFLFNLPERTTVCSVVICPRALRVWLGRV